MKQTPGKNTSQNNLIERKQIEGTPFTMIKQVMDNDKTKYFLVMGDHRLTEPTYNEEETLQKLLTEQWLITTNVIAIITDKMLEQQKTPYETEAL